ncbi:threonine synthase [Dissulfurirhabdus thermomarina]|uniref:Threonine synthase n=1 Tax=Dissulfurirhabdus thermomarina TaxID=1765737 RepID=A0A6N9TUN4_DISTH|nr:threonine synthase [Dissulfurirhabdus thermomarina]NDY43444.1 threonine synthase [Dissulfurirhabdus thermomarina]NMX22707.1 threonine synthase [Dissulfurirhabdus thermomarina]
MNYLSTRGRTAPVGFSEAVLMGLATDGGLLLPETVPEASPETLRAWRRLSYTELALEILALFADDIPRRELDRLVRRSYATFDTPEITPVVPVGDFFVLELFHGPTLAFKDVALQFLGNLFEWLLGQRGERMNILGATSGDTGSAAIYGVRGKENIRIFILHPHGRVSPVQALQMTTVPEDNVFNIAIRGTFDDGQAIIKSIFEDLAFKERYRLGAVNSINWTRVAAQVVYYVYAALRLQEREGADRVHFAVPTGNFGDIFAGYLARRLAGAAIGTLVLATNENNILTRFVNEGRYVRGTVVPTISPSMDIQVASNFERYLYYLLDEDPERVTEAMARFAQSGELRVGFRAQARVREDFVSASVGEAETLETIRRVYEAHGYLLDPHSAVGVAAAAKCRGELPPGPLVCLATAHPAKFPDAVRRATGRDPQRPPALRGLEDRPTRCEVLPADEQVIRDFIARHAAV